MTDPNTVYNRIESLGLMAGMRGDFPPDTALHVTELLMREGINVFELMTNSTEPIAAMKAVKQAYGDEAFVGMGTVLDVETAWRVLDAGADFVVAPSFQREVVRTVQDAGVMMIPGVITPTEAVDAWAMNVSLLKIFPIGPLGVDYFRAIRGPLSHMNFMCNGGTDGGNIGAFIKAGAVACGMADWLCGNGHAPPEQITFRARAVLTAVQMARTNEHSRKI